MYSLERKFVIIANSQIQILDRIWGVSADGWDAHNQEDKSHDRTLSALGEIKMAANSVQARGVLRAAGFCEDVYMRLGVKAGAKQRGALLGLKTLVFQYADGLFEIDPEFKDSLQSGSDEKYAAPEIAQFTDPYEHEIRNIEAARDRAAHTLKPLLRLVKDDNQQSALQKIMTVSQDVNTTPSAIEPVRAITPPRIAVKFEALMQTITDLTLSEARLKDKRVSISYMTDFDELGLGVANTLQEFIEVLCLNIVRHSVQKNTNTQISITGQIQDRAYIFDVQWQGTNLNSTLNARGSLMQSISVLTAQGGTAKFADVGEDLALSEHSLDALHQNINIAFPRKLGSCSPMENTVHGFGSEAIDIKGAIG